MQNPICKIQHTKYRQGSYLPIILLIAVIFIVMATSVASIAMANLKEATHNEKLVSSLEISEAGINYYIWHLSHDNKDYCDGNTCSGSGINGPFTHQYKDFSDNVVGSYDLYITPPNAGDSVITVKSVGRLNNSKSERTVIAEIGMPSFAKYSFLTNSECWFGPGETTNGPVHSNAGVHFDGQANGIVSSSLATYKPDASFGGDGKIHEGVWGNGGPKGFWVYPVPVVDFNKVSIDLVNLKAQAQAGGIFLDSSGSKGYYIKLQTIGTISVYRVSGVKANGQLNMTYLKDYDLPENGVVYAADNVWVDGTFNNHITIAAEITKNGQDATITIKDNLKYTAKDGSASVGLVAESDINVSQFSPDDLEIDAAMLSQKGHIWFPYVANAVKNNINIYGSIATNQFWTWTWTAGNNVTSGYKNTTSTYDPYLSLSPPPQFPTTGSFAILSWREE